MKMNTLPGLGGVSIDYITHINSINILAKYRPVDVLLRQSVALAQAVAAEHLVLELRYTNYFN